MRQSATTVYEPLVEADWPLRDWLHAEPLIRNPKDGSVLPLIPAGEFIASGDRSKFTVHLPAYYMALHPVTNAQYARFLTERAPSGADLKKWVQLDSDCFVRKSGSRYKAYGDKDDHPVVNVSWHGAQAYCEWAGVRLPTELEWEKGARGVDGREYPWGDDWEDGRRCRHVRSRKGKETTCGVWDYPEGCSPWGLYNMSGNVSEWCADWYDDEAYDRYKRGGLTSPASGGARVLRGGSWFNFAGYCRSASRDLNVPSFTDRYSGFRLVAVVRRQE